VLDLREIHYQDSEYKQRKGGFPMEGGLAQGVRTSVGEEGVLRGCWMSMWENTQAEGGGYLCKRQGIGLGTRVQPGEKGILAGDEWHQRWKIGNIQKITQGRG
jgi:hypothetical protein